VREKGEERYFGREGIALAGVGWFVREGCAGWGWYGELIGEGFAGGIDRMSCDARGLRG
jgi:hypothetical protein